MATLSVPRQTEAQPTQKKVHPTRLVLHYARRYTLHLVLTVVSMLLLVGAQLVIPWIIKVLVAAVTAGEFTAETFTLVTQLTDPRPGGLPGARRPAVRTQLLPRMWPVGAWSLTCASTFTNTCSA